MGSRANSDLIYGIAWDESECLIDEDNEIYKVMSAIEEKYEEVVFRRWSSEHTETYYLGITETHSCGDWDDPTIIDIEQLALQIKLKNFAYGLTIQSICQEFKLNYKDPKLIMLSTWE